FIDNDFSSFSDPNTGVSEWGTQFGAQNNLSQLIGQNPNGTWTLEIRDVVPSESGNLLSWSLDLLPGTQPPADGINRGNYMDQNGDAVTKRVPVAGVSSTPEDVYFGAFQTQPPPAPPPVGPTRATITSIAALAIQQAGGLLVLIGPPGAAVPVV